MLLSSRDFQRAALQRFTTAEFLLRNRYNLDAMYLAGYTVECSLKALILESTDELDRPSTLKKISSGTKMHSAEVLTGKLQELGCSIPLDLKRRLYRFIKTWSTDLRYRT